MGVFTTQRWYSNFSSVPQFRLGQLKDLSPVSLNQICLLEPPNLPLWCVFPKIDCSWYSVPENFEDDQSLLLCWPLFSCMLTLQKFLRKKKLVELKCINLVQQVALQLEFWLPPDDQLLLLWFSSKWSEWLTTAEAPFAINGESRSLIFAENKGTVIPLGLHCGSDSTTSYLLSLQSICKSISDLLDADLLFCELGECGFDTV